MKPTNEHRRVTEPRELPEIPLPTNGSENDIRCHVTRREISAGTREGEDVIEVLFEPHVQTGLIVERVVDWPFNPPIRNNRGRTFDGCRHLCYPVPGKEWYIDANLLLWSQLKYVAWNETTERIWGSFLGYTVSRMMSVTGIGMVWSSWRERATLVSSKV